MGDLTARFDPRAGSMSVLLPPTTAPFLCVDVSAQDARYTGALEYDIRGVKPGRVELRLPTAHASKLVDYADGELAILAKLAARCDGPAESFVVSSWDARATGPDIYILLNSRVPTTIAAGSGNRLEHEVGCKDLAEPAIAFNLRCEVPLSWLKAGKNLQVRMRRGQSFTMLPLAIRLP